MPGSKLPPFTLVQGPEISFVAGLFLGVYLISLAFANRWLIFTDDGWKFKGTIQWFTLIVTNAIAIPVSINQCLVTIIPILLADVILIYRLWMTLMKRWKFVLFPTILWFICFGCMVLQIVLMLEHIHHPDFGPYKWASVNMVVGPGIALIPLLGSSIVLHVYCSGLLIRRIWKSLRENENSSNKSQLRSLIRVFMESGILYVSINVAHFVVWFGYNNYAIHVMGSFHPALIGIVNNLIIIRVGQTRSNEKRHLSHEKITTLRCVPYEEASIGTSSK